MKKAPWQALRSRAGFGSVRGCPRALDGADTETSSSADTSSPKDQQAGGDDLSRETAVPQLGFERK